MRVSVAVPSRNYGRYLPACLESILGQDHEDLEVLVADGGSTDSSLGVVADFVDRDARVRLVSRNDEGQADAVRKALATASGGVFGFLNADDLYLVPDALSRVVDSFRREPEVDVVSFGGMYVDEEGRPVRPIEMRYHPRDRLEWIRYRPSVLQPATFWRRRVSEEIPFRVDLDYIFDAWFFFEAYRRFRWTEREDRIAGYRLHGENKSVGVRAERVDELARFEQFKFGKSSGRAAYLRRVATVLRGAERLPAGGSVLKRAIYLAVNSLAYASAYRIPGI